MPALNTLPATPLPDLPIAVTPAYAVREANFGDGYQMDAPAGVNFRTDKVDLDWSNINLSEFTILNNFFVAHSPSTPFWYTPPNGAQRVFKCRQWSYTRVSSGHYNLRATLTQFHGAA